MLKTRKNFRDVNKIYKNCNHYDINYNNFLKNLKADDVVLFFFPSLTTFPFKRLTFAKLKTHLHSLLHQFNLINHDCMGVYLHAEWVLGRLINDSILYRIYKNATNTVFKRYSGEDFYNHINNQYLSKKKFNATLQKFLNSGGNLGSGMKNKYLSLSFIEDPIITAGLKRINNNVYPTIKAFFGSRSKPAVYGNLDQIINPFQEKCFSEVFTDLCIRGEPIKIMDTSTFSATRPTPNLLLSPNKYFSNYPSSCVSRTLACFYETLNSISEKSPSINKKINELYNQCNSFNIPIPRESFFLYFKDIFHNCYKI